MENNSNENSYYDTINKIIEQNSSELNNQAYGNSKPKSVAKIVHILTVSFFALMLCALLIGSILTPDKTFSKGENRNLEQFPDFSVGSLLNGSFMSRFETYMTDQIVLRDQFVKANTTYNRLLGETEINGVYVGKNAQLFEVPSEYDEEKVFDTIKVIGDFAKKIKVPNQQFMLVPNSTEILNEQLPNFLTCKSQQEQINAVYSKLPSEIVGIDVCSAFKDADDKDKFYFKNDHHWTARGAFCAFQGYMDKNGFEYKEEEFEFLNLSNSFYGTLAGASGIYSTPDNLEVVLPKNSEGTYFIQNAETGEKSSSVFDLSKLETFNQYEVFFGGNFSKIEITTKAKNKNALLVFKDSYANSFIPMLTPYFHKIVIIDPRYYTDNIENELEKTNFTHALYLYNVNTFFEDISIKDVLN